MFSKFVQVVLALSSVLPLLVAYLYGKITSNHNPYIYGSLVLLTILLSTLLYYVIIKTAERKLEKMPVTISQVRYIGYKNNTFFFVYFAPLVFYPHIPEIIFLFILSFSTALALTTDIYYYNFYFATFTTYDIYEAKLSNGETCLLITKKKYADFYKQVNEEQIQTRVVQPFENVLVEKE